MAHFQGGRVTLVQALPSSKRVILVVMAPVCLSFILQNFIYISFSLPHLRHSEWFPARDQVTLAKYDILHA